MLDIILGLVMLLISAGIVIAVKDFPSATIIEGLGPGFMPTLLAIILSLLALVLIIIGLINKLKNSPSKATLNFSVSSVKGPIILFASIIFYLLALHYLGFIISTPFLVIASMIIMGSKLKMAFIMSIILTGTTYMFFEILFKVSLPQGILF